MKIYSWYTFLVTLFVGGGGIAWFAIRLINGKGDFFHLFWIGMGVYLVWKGLKASLTKEGYEEDQRRGKIGKRVYKKLFGPFAPIMPFSTVIFFFLACLTVVFLPPLWLYVLLLACVVGYAAWLSWIVQKHYRIEEELVRLEEAKEQTMKFEHYLDSLKDKTVAVIGIGVSNRPLIDLLCSYGISVTACDKKIREALGAVGDELEAKGVRLRLGEDYLENLTEDVIFRTPGMRPDLPQLTAAVERGSILTSEMEVFFDVCPCTKIAVTGSDGKTTTTTIIAELLRAAGKTVHLGGNIGHPLLAETGSMHSDDVAVLELSSFQLMTMQNSPHIAVLTNLAPNHLDVHKDYAEYIAAKENNFIYQQANDIAVFNADNTDSVISAEKAVSRVRWFSRQKELEEGVFLRGDAIMVRHDGQEREVMRTSDIKLPGVHNIENYMAAVAAVDGLVPDDVIREFARNFGGVEHRIELVRTRNGVRWYNDSIASSPSRTIAGLKAFPERVILIAGGKDKGIPYDDIGPIINEHVKLLILCGATAGVIRSAVEKADNYSGLKILDAEDYQQAVAMADEASCEGDVVILSPASTSFDRFVNFMERGRIFKEIVNELP